MRPNSKYKPEYAEQIPEMFAEGKTLYTVCAELLVTKNTFYAWTKKYPEFAEAYELGQVLQKSWWMERYRLWSVREAPGNGAGFIFYLKTQCNWSEFRDNSKNPEEIEQHLKTAMDKAKSKTCPIPRLKVVE